MREAVAAKADAEIVETYRAPHSRARATDMRRHDDASFGMFSTTRHGLPAAVLASQRAFRLSRPPEGRSVRVSARGTTRTGYVFPRVFAAAVEALLAAQAVQRGALPLAFCQYSCVVDTAVHDEDVGAGS